MFYALASMVLGLGLRGDAHLTFPFEQYHHNGRYLWAKRWKASGGMQREDNILETCLHITEGQALPAAWVPSQFFHWPVKRWHPRAHLLLTSPPQ